MRRLVLIVALLGLPAVASAQTDQSRPPEGTHLHEQPGMPDHLLLGTTFGALVSNDGGKTWHWICENAVGYGGAYDPDYVYTPAGSVIATTFEGLHRMTNGCEFEPTALGSGFATTVTQGADGTIHAAMSEVGDPTATPPKPADFKIYRSTNDGVSWDAGLTVGTGGETWNGIEAAPSDPQRVYLTAFRVATPRTYVLARSTNGGTSYAPLSVAAFTVTEQSEIIIEAVAPDDPDRALVRVTRALGAGGNAFYLTTNGGTSWTKVLEVDDTARGILWRAGGEVLIGTRASGMYRSINDGATFAQVGGAQPAVYCLHERPGGVVWACTEPYAAAPFDAALMSTPDVAAWTSVLRFQDLDGPAECAPGSIQHDCCTYDLPECPIEFPSTWCRIVTLLQVTDSSIACDMPDAGPAGGDGTGPPGKGCCDAGDGPLGAGVLTLVVMWGVARRRPRRA